MYIDVYQIFQKTILKRCSHGDWFMLSMIMDNMNVVVRGSFIQNLEIRKKEFDSERVN